MGTKGIKPFDVAALTKVNIMNPKNVGYQDSIDIIHDELHKTRKSFIKIGWYLKHINEANMYKEDGYATIYEFAHDKFKISQSTTTRFIELCNEFSVGHDSPELDEKYLNYNISQLFEMLSMLHAQREQITPDMTIRQIREIKNEAKNEVKEPSDDDNHSELDDNIPGQTSIAKDFPEYMPDDISVEAEPEQENQYATSHKKEVDEKEIIDGEYREVKSDEDKSDDSETDQPELPKFKNNAQRKAWIEDVEAWGLWYEDSNIQARYYKYDFVDGSRLIAVKYRYTCPPWIADKELNGEYKDTYYHMIYSDEYRKINYYSYDEYYTNSTVSINSLIDFIKEIAKQGDN